MRRVFRISFFLRIKFKIINEEKKKNAAKMRFFVITYIRKSLS